MLLGDDLEGPLEETKKLVDEVKFDIHSLGNYTMGNGNMIRLGDKDD